MIGKQKRKNCQDFRVFRHFSLKKQKATPLSLCGDAASPKFLFLSTVQFFRESGKPLRFLRPNGLQLSVFIFCHRDKPIVVVISQKLFILQTESYFCVFNFQTMKKLSVMKIIFRGRKFAKSRDGGYFPAAFRRSERFSVEIF